MASILWKLSAFVIFASLFQCVVYAQEESPPQTRLSSKGLAYVNLSTSPADPITGQPTIILIQFLDPQNKLPRGDIYYRVVISNSTSPVFVMPGGSTIAGKVGIPYQFDSPGNYQVEIDLNDTDISKSSSGSLDKATFPLYVTQGTSQVNQTSSNATVPNNPQESSISNKDNEHLLIDGILVAIAIGLVALIIRNKVRSRKNKSI